MPWGRPMVRAGDGLVAVDEGGGAVSQAPSFLGTKADIPDGQDRAGPWKALRCRQRPGASHSAGSQRKE